MKEEEKSAAALATSFADVSNNRWFLKCQYYVNFPRPVPLYLHCHTEYEFMLIVSGNVRVRSGAATPEAPTPCVVIHRPYAMHSVEMLPGADYKRYIFYFSEETLRRTEAAVPAVNALGRMGDVWLLTVPPEALDGFVSLMDSFASATGEDEAVRALYAVTALARLPSLSPVELPQVNARTSYVQDVIAAIHNDPLGDLSIGSLAERFFVSPSKLTHDFRRYAACSVHEYVTMQRLNRACALLRAGRSVTDAAAESGWTYVSAFIRAFHARYGMTPGDYAGGSGRR